jgi:hypothetical protein
MAFRNALVESKKNKVAIELMFELRHRLEEAVMSFASLGEITE